MNILNLLICLFNSGLMVYTFVLFFDSFAEQRFSIHIYSLYTIGLTIVYTVILYFVPLGMLRTLLLISMPILTSLLFNFKWYNHIFLSLLIFAIGSVAELAVAAILSAIFSISPHDATHGIFQIIGIILSKLVIIVFITIFRIRKYKILYARSPQKFYFLFLIPISAIVVVFVHVYWFLQIPFTSQPLSVSNIISYIVLIVSNIISFQIVDASYKNAEKDKQLATAQELIQAQAEQYTQLQEHNSVILKMRHDHRNFLIGLINELENGNSDSALTSLHNEYKILNDQYETELQSNIMETIVKVKAAAAQEHKITINFTYDELERIQISPIDIAIILGNALDNAIEATQKNDIENRTIDVLINISNNLIVIAIKNPVVSDLNVNHLVSTKRANQSYGFGIVSMKNIAAKYDGDVIFTCENKKFNTHIVLRNAIDE